VEARTRAYLAAGVPVIWLPIIDLRQLDAPKRVRGLPLVCIARFRAPAWQRWVRGYHLLGPWYYDVATASLWRGRFSPVHLWRGEHVPDGAGGADWRLRDRYRSEAYRILDLEGPFEPSDVRIDVVE
jgi:competence protein CoiA